MVKKKIVCGLLAAATLIYNQPRIDVYAEEEIQEEIILEENTGEIEQDSETVENAEDEVVEEETVNEEALNQEPENTEIEEETKSYTVTWRIARSLMMKAIRLNWRMQKQDRF